MKTIDQETICRLKSERVWVSVSRGDFVYNTFSMLKISHGNEIDKINGEDIFHCFYVGLKVNEDESVVCDIYNTNAEFITSTDGRKMLSPNTIDVFDLSVALADEIVKNEKDDILSRIPTKFVKAYPNLKQFVAVRFNNQAMQLAATPSGTDKQIYESEMEKRQTTTLSTFEMVGKK